MAKLALLSLWLNHCLLLPFWHAPPISVKGILDLSIYLTQSPGGMARAHEILKEGVKAATLARGVASGKIWRLTRGLYQCSATWNLDHSELEFFAVIFLGWSFGGWVSSDPAPKGPATSL